MAVYKNKSNNTWYVSVYYKNWQGSTDRKVKRGFKTKREASEWERTFLLQRSDDIDMTFGAFWELYKADLKEKIRENTWNTKISVIEKKVLPYFQNKKLCEIKPTDIMSWQNEMMGYRDSAGKPYSKTYLKTIHNQISAIFNHAVKFYDLKSNPAAKVGNMGKEQTKEMQFWTKPEYLKFAEAIMDKPISYYAFEILYWCGLRLGELLALTPADLDEFEAVAMPVDDSDEEDDDDDECGFCIDDFGEDEELPFDGDSDSRKRVLQMMVNLLDVLSDRKVTIHIAP